jgi:hypothetical protein
MSISCGFADFYSKVFRGDFSAQPLLGQQFKRADYFRQ